MYRVDKYGFFTPRFGTGRMLLLSLMAMRMSSFPCSRADMGDFSPAPLVLFKFSY